MGLLRFIARSIFAWTFLAVGFSALTKPGGRPELVKKSLPLPEPELLVRLNGALMVTGGAALALGIRPRLAALGLAATLVPTTYVGHPFWNQTDPAAKRNHQVHFNKNLTMIGGLLAYALTADD
jgi:putative oxidoreductase